MPNLFQAKEELEHAKYAIKQFSEQTNFNPYNKPWINFVISLELCFIKAERGCQDIRNKFEPFQGRYKNLRKKDPLLSYLKNSRDAVIHDDQIVIDLEITNEDIVTDIRSLWELDKKGNKIKEIKAYFHPAAIRLKPLVNLGVTYNPPTIHLGKSLLCDRNPFEVAYLGIKFYDEFLKEIERKFINKIY